VNETVRLLLARKGWHTQFTPECRLDAREEVRLRVSFRNAVSDGRVESVRVVLDIVW
jgi:hypothetical protein